jgi:hypothetical protein
VELETIEAVVRRLFTDEEFRAAATADSAAALSEYDLGTNERAALASLCERLSPNDGLVGANIFWF